jgi:hypothetical protein
VRGLAHPTPSSDACRQAPDRRSVAPFFGLAAGTAVELWRGVYAELDCAGETHVLRLRDSTREPDRTEAAFAVRGTLGLGKRF